MILNFIIACFLITFYIWAFLMSLMLLSIMVSTFKYYFYKRNDEDIEGEYTSLED